MKKIALIDFTNIYSFSIRSISSYLRDKGFGVAAFHCGSANVDMFTLLSERSLELLAEHCRDYDVVGISLLSTHYLNRAIQINNYLKKRIKAKIIWGGVTVICNPNFHLKYADYICAGEGETVIEKFLEEEPPMDIPGLGYKTANGEFVVNSLPPLIDVNEVAIPYFDLENTFILEDDKITSLKEDTEPLFSLSKKGYRLFSTRGCAYACTYCSNNRLKEGIQRKGAACKICPSVKNYIGT